MGKLIIQIPCYNEEKTLALALAELPREVEGVDEVEWLVIDDGSQDKTVEVAQANGVDHIVKHPRNMGLARAFMTGIDACLKRGADFIVNTDADNQYNAADIPALVKPILDHRAEMVIGARPIMDTQHFSPIKKALQKLGSWVVRKASGAPVDDAPSGFRAFSRSAASRLIVFSAYTYTLETIIQAGKQGMAVVSVPVRTNADLRPSRLVKSIRTYVTRSLQTIFRIYVTYSPLRFFLSLGAVSLAFGLLFLIRFLYFYSIGLEDDHIPSLIISAFMFGMGFFLAMLGLLADLLAINRKLLEDVRWRLFRLEEQHWENPSASKNEKDKNHG